MLKSYLKIAWRFLWKKSAFGFVNIFGLAVGTLCCLYIVMFVQEQYSYDRHHNDVKDIYRVTSWLKLTGDIHSMATSSPPVGPAIQTDFAEVLKVTRVAPTSALGVKQHLLRYKDKSFYETDAVFVDSTFFDIFKYHFTSGNASNVLNEPYTLVLQKSTADKLFGQVDPIGKAIEIDDAYGNHEFKVTGVVDESLGKSHIKANIFIAMRSGGIGEFVLQNESWGGSNFLYTYVKLHPNADVAAFEKKLPAFLNRHGEQQLKALGMEKQLHLQPVTSVHTTSGHEAESGKSVNPSFLNILLLIAALVQVVACINFMNLSTARASKRAKEVGVRKVMGAQRSDLVKQFLGESLLLSLIGVLVALPLLWLALPYINRITGADLHLSALMNYRFWLILVCLALVTGLLAGSYPAFYLSAFRITKVLKGNFTNHISASGLRRSLVVFQFVLSIVFITGIIVINSQLNYIKGKDLGFEKDQKIVFSFYTGDGLAQIPPFMDDLRRLSDVKVVSKSTNYPSQLVYNGMSFFLAGGNMATSQNADFMETDENFVKAMGIKIISGRDFHLHDSSYILINETLAKKLGLKAETAPGTRLYSQYASLSTYTVAGVMKDFNYNSLYESVKPFALVYDLSHMNLSNVIVNVNSTNYKALLGKMADIWRKDLPGIPFEYSFLDTQVEKQYETEATLSKIINSFTGITIVISCLGLFGLTAFNAEQRRKEIGIRKVLGANVFSVTALLSADFLKLVAIAIVVATPISWWGMNKWLQAFAYRTDITWWMFAIAGLLALFITFFTISFQTIKAALSNPVDNLRRE